MPQPLRLVLALLLGLWCAPAARAEEPLKIGLLDGLSGPDADIGGKGKVVAAQMAIDDFGGTVLGRKIELLASDHQNKPDIGAGIARQWYDMDHVQMITGMSNSAVGLAVRSVSKSKHKLDIMVGAIVDSLIGENCSPTGVLWSATATAIAGNTAKTLLHDGYKTWYFITNDYAGGHALEKAAMDPVRAGGGTVLGVIRHPFGTTDFSSFLLSAQASHASVVAISNTGTDTINSIKQANEFGLRAGGQTIAATYFDATELPALGPKASDGIVYTTAFYWDLNDPTRAWSQRFLAKRGNLPAQTQALTYAAVTHYLKAVAAAGSDDPDRVVAKMRELPVNDPITGKGWLRDDGRVMYDMYVLRTHGDGHSALGPGVELERTVPANEAFAPVSPACKDSPGPQAKP